MTEHHSMLEACFQAGHSPFTVREYINELNRMIIVGEVQEDALMVEYVLDSIFPAQRPVVDSAGRLDVAGDGDGDE